MSLFDLHFDFGQWTIPFFRRRQKTILIVEDDNFTVGLIRFAAEAHGYEVETAGTAEEAIGALHRNGKHFVLALLDVHLPGMSGWDLRRKLRDLYPALRVVVMSADAHSFQRMPEGETLQVLIKTSNYGDFFRALK